MDSLNLEKIEIAKQILKRLIEDDFIGNDPYQIDELVFSDKSKFKFLKRLRMLLKPFHALIPKKIFTSFPKLEFPTVYAQILQSNARLFAITNDKSFLAKQDELFEKLLDLSLSDKVLVFGLPFEWGGAIRYKKNTPFTVDQAFILEAFIDCYRYLGDQKYLDAALKVVRYLIDQVKIINYDNDSSYVHYSEQDKIIAFNVVAVTAYVLTYYLKYSKTELYSNNEIKKLLRYVCKMQKDDGSWEYGLLENTKFDVVDNRHTCYIIYSFLSIKEISTEFDSIINSVLDSAITYYKINMLDGYLPKWSAEETFPIDSSDIAMSLLIQNKIYDLNSSKLFKYAIENLYDGKGGFYFKIYSNGKKNKSLFIRWSHGWMYYSIARIIKNEN